MQKTWMISTWILVVKLVMGQTPYYVVPLVCHLVIRCLLQEAGRPYPRHYQDLLKKSLRIDLILSNSSNAFAQPWWSVAADLWTIPSTASSRISILQFCSGLPVGWLVILVFEEPSTKLQLKQRRITTSNNPWRRWWTLKQSWVTDTGLEVHRQLNSNLIYLNATILLTGLPLNAVCWYLPLNSRCWYHFLRKNIIMILIRRQVRRYPKIKVDAQLGRWLTRKMHHTNSSMPVRTPMEQYNPSITNTFTVRCY